MIGALEQLPDLERRAVAFMRGDAAPPDGRGAVAQSHEGGISLIH